MAQQLIYTSYPTSLVRGRSGFSTVARSRGMTEALSAMVERCSVYDSSLVSGAVFSHRILKLGSKNWHLLSRICACGVDYTNRNNYIAHHLVFSEEEILNLANSAEIMLNWQGWVDFWDKEPCFIDDVDFSALTPPSSLPAKTWKNIFGDAAYAALFGTANGEIIGGRKDGETILQLFCESLSLFVNRLDSWLITYTTCYFNGENSADFIWRGILDVNVANKRDIPNLTTRQTPELPNGRAAEYARSGELNNVERYNLKVSKPEFKQRNFEVVESEDKKSSALAIILIGVIAGLLLLIGVLLSGMFLI